MSDQGSHLNTDLTVGEDLWETHSAWWQAGFTEGADPEYQEQIIPLLSDLLGGAERVLDVGTGEGQIARLAVATGSSRVVGIDPTRNQIRAAREQGGGVEYVRADAAELPFISGSFDAVVVCLVFEHIAAVDAAVDEVARVLATGGRFLFLLNHPLLQTPGSGWIDDHILDPPEQYWRVGPYLLESYVVEEVRKDVYIPFIHRPLSRYINALIDSGLVLERVIEPAPPPGFLAKASEYEHAATIPRLLGLVSRRV